MAREQKKAADNIQLFDIRLNTLSLAFKSYNMSSCLTDLFMKRMTDGLVSQLESEM